jgi:ribosomal protein S18 acetylase RimI-like enzyme
VIGTDVDLYARGVATLLACWEAIACGSADATVQRHKGVAAAVFPSGPERTVYNNAVLERGLAAPQRRAALDAMEAAYAAAGIDHYAAWVHESDPTMSHELLTRGYKLAESTRAMGRSLDDLADTRPAFDLNASDLFEHVEIIGLPGLLRGVDPAGFHVVVARLANERVATAMAFDHAGDCGVFNVGTLESARRRGIATAVTHRLLQDAAARGCTTASLQATEMAEGVYAAAGFRDLGRILEYVPAPRLHEGAIS